MDSERRMHNSFPYLILGLVCLGAHGFLLTNDGVAWDGWYFYSWLKHKNWAPFKDYAMGQGMPFSLPVLAALSIFPDVIFAGMVAVVICLWLQGVVIYHLARKLGPLNRGEALALAVLYQACPLVSVGQEFPILTLFFYQMLFLAAGLMAARAMELHGWRHWALRGAALAAFLMSCWTNGSLLMVYGSMYVLLFIHYRRLTDRSVREAAPKFLWKYPDLFVLPPLALWARNFFSPQYGWFESYNKPTADPVTIGRTFWSFFENVVPYHLERCASWLFEHPFLALGLAVFLFLWPRLAPGQWAAERSTLRSIHLLWFALLSFLLGVLPLAVIGKTFLEPAYGEFSRWTMHVPLPFALVAIAALRSVCFMGRTSLSRWFPAVTTCAVVVLGSQIAPVYVGERVEWIFSRALLHQASKNEAVKASSVLVLQGFSVTRQFVYALYGLAEVFGEMTRIVIPSATAPDRGFFFPGEVGRIILWTTMLPNELNRINPAGQQVLIEGIRTRGDATDLGIASHYFWIRMFGKTGEMDAFLASLCSIKVTVLKAATPLITDPASPTPEPPPTGLQSGEFTNGLGMRLVRVGEMWAGKFETTQAQYERVMAANPSLFKDPARPVERVSWYDATGFCRRLTESERKAGRIPDGYEYRLPTADEFDRMLAEGNLRGSVTAVEEIHWQTAPAGSKPPNSLGLHDVVGNVWEWCMDWWDEEHRFKISKGGGWTNFAEELFPYSDPRSERDWTIVALIDRFYGPFRRDYPDQAFWDRGFRVVLAAANPKQQQFLKNMRKKR